MIEDRDERIRQRAYRMWEEEGRPEGRADDHWQRAAREIEREDREDFGDDDRRGLQTQRLTETGDGASEPALGPEAGGGRDGRRWDGTAAEGRSPAEPSDASGPPAGSRAAGSRRRAAAIDAAARLGSSVGRK